MGELLNVQAPGSDVGSHQDLHRAAFEVGRACCRAVWLLLPWMAAAEMPALDQIPGHLVGPVLGAGKHQAVFHVPAPG